MNQQASELNISRLIKAPRKRVWEAWSTPELFAQWWIPELIECQVVKMDLRPGGGFETRMREGGGEFQPHVEACFLEVVPEERLIWTTSLCEGYRPLEPWLALTAIITFEPKGQDTHYSARVMHRSPEDRRKHEELGFFPGWGTVTDQLARAVERGSAIAS